VELPPFTVFASAEEAAGAPEPESPEGVSFLKEQQWKIRTKTEPVTKRLVTERLRLAGVVAVQPGSKAAVTPPVAGHLAPPPGLSLPQLGSRVEQGQVLALVQPHLVGSDLLTFINNQQQIQAMELELTVKGAEAEAEAIRTRVVLTQAEQALQRVQTLFISREQVERKIVVMCNVAGCDVASVVEDVRRLVDPLIAERGGYSVSYGGQFESAEEAGRFLSVLGVMVILGIGALLYLAFGSARDAALVMVNLPLALIGGVAGVFRSGGVLSVASLIGFITVFGITDRNGIMLVSHIRHLQEHEGVTDFREAVFRGAMERLSPIFMTALAMGLALIPLAVSGEKPGNEIQTPMAIVILFGLLTSMGLNMLIVPALYLRFGRPVEAGKEGGRR
jgi:Cu/Ag efflux pump CusA